MFSKNGNGSFIILSKGKSHGENALEFELMVKYGMAPMNVVLTATRDAALALELGGGK